MQKAKDTTSCRAVKSHLAPSRIGVEKRALGQCGQRRRAPLGGRDPLIFRLIRLACLRSFAFETAGCSHGASDSRGRRAARCGCRERGSMRRCSWRGCQVNQMKGQGSHRQLQPKWRHAVWQLDDRRRLLLLHGLTQLLCACSCMSCTIWHNVITDLNSY